MEPEKEPLEDHFLHARTLFHLPCLFSERFAGIKPYLPNCLIQTSMCPPTKTGFLNLPVFELVHKLSRKEPLINFQLFQAVLKSCAGSHNAKALPSLHGRRPAWETLTRSAERSLEEMWRQNSTVKLLYPKKNPPKLL